MKKKNKLVKYFGITLITTALIHGGISIYDSSIDHTEEICPLTDILGVGHQIDVINNNQNNISNGIRASYMESELELQDYIFNEDGTATKTIEIDPIVVIDENGNKTLSAPSGFILDGDKCYRTITVDDIYADYGMIIIERNGVTENILNIKKGK